MVEFPDIDRLMAGPLGSFLHDQQAERRAAKRQAWNRGRTALLVGGSLAMLFMIVVPFDTTPKLWAIGFAASIVAAWVWKPIAAAKRRVKIGINEGLRAGDRVVLSEPRPPIEGMALTPVAVATDAAAGRGE